MTLHNTYKQRGFTLLELMIVVAIVGILTAVALPSYLVHIEKSRRSDAMESVLDCAAAQARYFSTQSPSTYFDQNGALGAAANANRFCGSDGGNLNSKEGYYRLTITNSNPNACTTTAGSFWCFAVEASPTPGGPQLNDEDCQIFRVDHRGYRSSEDSGGNDSTETCWRS